MELTKEDEKALSEIKSHLKNLEETFDSLPQAKDEKEFALKLNNTQRTMAKFRSRINSYKKLHPVKGMGYRRSS